MACILIIKRLIVWLFSMFYKMCQSLKDGFKISCIAPLRDSVAVKPFLEVNKLLTKPPKEMMSSTMTTKLLTKPPKEMMSSTMTTSPSLVMKQYPQYQYEANAIEGNELPDVGGKLDKYIEDDSTEYKWSPQPEMESVESIESANDTPEELYSASDKRGEQLD